MGVLSVYCVWCAEHPFKVDTRIWSRRTLIRRCLMQHGESKNARFRCRSHEHQDSDRHESVTRLGSAAAKRGLVGSPLVHCWRSTRDRSKHHGLGGSKWVGCVHARLGLWHAAGFDTQDRPQCFAGARRRRVARSHGQPCRDGDSPARI